MGQQLNTTSDKRQTVTVGVCLRHTHTWVCMHSYCWSYWTISRPPGGMFIRMFDDDVLLIVCAAMPSLFNFIRSTTHLYLAGPQDRKSVALEIGWERKYGNPIRYVPRNVTGANTSMASVLARQARSLELDCAHTSAHWYVLPT